MFSFMTYYHAIYMLHLLFSIPTLFGYLLLGVGGRQHPCWLFIQGGDWSKPLKVYFSSFDGLLCPCWLEGLYLVVSWNV